MFAQYNGNWNVLIIRGFVSYPFLGSAKFNIMRELELRELQFSDLKGLGKKFRTEIGTNGDYKRVVKFLYNSLVNDADLFVYDVKEFAGFTGVFNKSNLDLYVNDAIDASRDIYDSEGRMFLVNYITDILDGIYSGVSFNELFKLK